MLGLDDFGKLDRWKYRHIDNQIERKRDLYKVQVYKDIYFCVMIDSYIDGQINKQRQIDRQIGRYNTVTHGKNNRINQIRYFLELCKTIFLLSLLICKISMI